MDTPEIAQRLEDFLRHRFHIAADDPGFNRTVHLFERGYVDSIGVIETLGFITETFGVEIPDSVLVSDAFTHIDGMAQSIADLLRDRSEHAPVRAS